MDTKRKAAELASRCVAIVVYHQHARKTRPNKGEILIEVRAVAAEAAREMVSTTVILAEVLFSILGALGCFWINMVGRAEIGACLPVATVVREIFAELLTAILALLLAGRVPPPPPPGDE